MRSRGLGATAVSVAVLAVIACPAVRGQDTQPSAGSINSPPGDQPVDVGSAKQPVGATETIASDPPAARDEETQTPAPVSAEDILREFQRDRPRAVPVLPKPPEDEVFIRQPEGKVGSLGMGAGGPSMQMPDGYMLVDRSGRLLQEGDWWLITFTADNNPLETPAPPLKILPNQMLERMVRESQGGAQSVEFIVSGEVTNFMGENYLLLRKLLRKRNTGNLGQ